LIEGYQENGLEKLFMGHFDQNAVESAIIQQLEAGIPILTKLKNLKPEKVENLALDIKTNMKNKVDAIVDGGREAKLEAKTQAAAEIFQNLFGKAQGREIYL
jgi:hypothetical protein